MLHCNKIYVANAKIAPDGGHFLRYDPVCIAKIPARPAVLPPGQADRDARPGHARQALDFPHLCRAIRRRANSNALYRKNLAKGQTGLSVAFDLPTQTGYDSRPRAGRGRGRQGRRAGLPSRRHARAVRRHPARHHEHLDDHQRHRGVADGALHRGRRRAGRAARGAARHDPERHHQGISVARHLRVSAGAVDAADQGRGDLHHDANCRNGIR